MISISLPEEKAFEILITELSSFRVIEKDGEFVLAILTGFTLKDNRYYADITQMDISKDDEVIEYFVKDDILGEDGNVISGNSYSFNSARFSGKDKDKETIKELNHILKRLYYLKENASISVDSSYDAGISIG